jgi:hypothetical protein
MAADQFTQIRNAVFRDSRLTGKAMGIFGNISTHRDGWGITPESISTQMRDGVSAIKAGLRELEKYGYLQRERERRPDGTLGGSEYFITDQPEAVAMSSSRPEPGVDFPPVDEPPVGCPPVDQPPVDEPTVDDHPHKKTIPLQEDHWVEDELLSPPLPAQRPEPDPVHEREMLSPFEDPQQSDPLPGVDAYTAQLADADAVTRVTASWVETYRRSSGGSEPSAKAVSRVRASAGSRLRAGKSVDELILIAIDMAETNLTWTDLAEHEAHWLHKQQQRDGLTGQEADPAFKPSVTDQRVQQALNVGRQMQAEADARRGGGYRPQNLNDAWDHVRQQADAGERPDGWEKYPHCGRPDCDEITRMRDTDDGSGELRPTYCSGCHPVLQWY